MHILLPLLLSALLPSTTTALALDLPTGSTVAQDVLNIDAAVRALDATVQAYNGAPLPVSLVEGTPVLVGVAGVHRVNRVGFAHALAARPFSVGESVGVVDAVVESGEFLFARRKRGLRRGKEGGDEIRRDENMLIRSQSTSLFQLRRRTSKRRSRRSRRAPSFLLLLPVWPCCSRITIPSALRRWPSSVRIPRLTRSRREARPLLTSTMSSRTLLCFIRRIWSE